MKNMFCLLIKVIKNILFFTKETKMSPKLIRPIRTKPKVSSPYGWRDLNGSQNFHTGIDYINADDLGDGKFKGDKMVVAMCDGICVADNDNYDQNYRYDVNSKHSLGNYIYLQHVIDGITYYVLYAHLKQNNFNPGDRVKQGDVLGEYSDYGYSFGDHLHIQFYDINWQTINPTSIILEGVK